MKAPRYMAVVMALCALAGCTLNVPNANISGQGVINAAAVVPPAPSPASASLPPVVVQPQATTAPVSTATPSPTPTPSPEGPEECSKAAPAARAAAGTEKHGRYKSMILPNGWDYLEDEASVTAAISRFEAEGGEHFECFMKFYSGAWSTYQQIKSLPPVTPPPAQPTTPPAVSGSYDNGVFAFKYSRAIWRSREPSVAELGDGVLAILWSQVGGKGYNFVVWRVSTDLTLDELSESVLQTSDKYWPKKETEIDGERAIHMFYLRGAEYRTSLLVDHAGVKYELAVTAPSSITASEESAIASEVSKILATWEWR